MKNNVRYTDLIRLLSEQNPGILTVDMTPLTCISFRNEEGIVVDNGAENSRFQQVYFIEVLTFAPLSQKFTYTHKEPPTVKGV